MQKLFYFKGELAKILTVLLVLTITILTPVSELMVQAEEMVAEELEEAAMPENSAGGAMKPFIRSDFRQFQFGRSCKSQRS